MKRKTIRTLFLVGGLIFGLLVLYRLYISFRPELELLAHFNHHNESLLIKIVRSHGAEDLIFLFLLNALCVAIPGLSNGIFCVLNGILYGPALGFVINWFSDLLGQFVLMNLLQQLYNLRKVSHSRFYQLLMNQNYPQAGLTVAYMIPFIPTATVSYVNLLINKKSKKRLLPIAIGCIPFAFLYAYGGDSILHLDGKRLISTIIILILLALIAIIFLWCTRVIRKHHQR